MNDQMAFLLPELTLTAGALALLFVGVMGLRRKLLGFIAMGSMAMGLLAMPGTLGAGHVVFSGLLVNDGFSFMMRSFVVVAAGMAVWMSMACSWPDHEDAGEYYFFLLAATVAMMLAVSAGNLLMIYLAVETLSIVSYILACFFKKDLYSTEAGLKYFLFGALSTGLMLYGISLAYGLMGTLDLRAIAAGVSAGTANGPMLALAGVLIFAGLAFKASLVPFHMWVADVYEGAPWPVAAFFSIGPKALGFALLVRVFFIFPAFISSGWALIPAVVAVATMTAGNFSAFHQNSVKRLLAFSSVAQAGYILAGLAAGYAGLNAAFFYIAIYAFMNMGAFACAAFLSPVDPGLGAYQGMVRRAPLGAMVFSVFLLSLAGLPPLAGFFAKFFVIFAAIKTHHGILAAAIVINSVVAFFYYLKIIKAMYFDAPSHEGAVRIPFSGQLLLALCVTAVVALGVWPGPVFQGLAVLFH